MISKNSSNLSNGRYLQPDPGTVAMRSYHARNMYGIGRENRLQHTLARRKSAQARFAFFSIALSEVVFA